MFSPKAETGNRVPGEAGTLNVSSLSKADALQAKGPAN